MRRKHYQDALIWYGKALPEQRRATGHPEWLVDSLNGIAGCQSQLKLPDKAVETLRQAVPYIRGIGGDDSRAEHAVNTLSALAWNLDAAHDSVQATAIRAELLPYLEELAVLRKKTLRRDRTPKAISNYHVACLNWATNESSLGKRDRARKIMDDELATLKQTVGPCRPMVDCYIGMSWMQDSPELSIRNVESAMSTMQTITKSEDDRKYLSQIRATLGVAYEGAGRLKEALPLLEEVERTCSRPNYKRVNWEIYAPFGLANTYLGLGREAEALALYRKYLSPLKPGQYRDVAVVQEAKMHYRSLTPGL